MLPLDILFYIFLKGKWTKTTCNPSVKVQTKIFYLELKKKKTLKSIVVLMNANLNVRMEMLKA